MKMCSFTFAISPIRDVVSAGMNNARRGRTNKYRLVTKLISTATTVASRLSRT